MTRLKAILRLTSQRILGVTFLTSGSAVAGILWFAGRNDIQYPTKLVIAVNAIPIISEVSLVIVPLASG